MMMKFSKQLILVMSALLLIVPAVMAQDTDYCSTAAEDIEYGDRVDGSIDDDVPFAAFCFEGEEDDEITVVVETTDGDLISTVFVADPFLEEVFAENTARNENSESEISYTLEDDGQYLIIVSREDLDEGNTEGDFELNLSVEGGDLGSNNTSNNNNSSNSDIETACDEEPLATLSQFQYGIPGSDPAEPLLAYNVGCTGFLVSTVVGRSIVVEYEIDRRGDMSFLIGDTTYTTVNADDEEWVLELSNGDELTLERLEDEGCDDEPLADLILGAWLVEDAVFDFSCNGVVLLTFDGETSVTEYELDRDDIVISLDDDDIVLENFEIDDNVLAAEVNGDELELENLLD